MPLGDCSPVATHRKSGVRVNYRTRQNQLPEALAIISHFRRAAMTQHAVLTQRGGAVAKSRLPWRASLGAGRGPAACAAEGSRVLRVSRPLPPRPAPSSFWWALDLCCTLEIARPRPGGAADSGAPCSWLLSLSSLCASVSALRGNGCFSNAISGAYECNLLFSLHVSVYKKEGIFVEHQR